MKKLQEWLDGGTDRTVNIEWDNESGLCYVQVATSRGSYQGWTDTFALAVAYANNTIKVAEL